MHSASQTSAAPMCLEAQRGREATHRIVIICSVRLFRDGLATLLESRTGAQVICAADSSEASGPWLDEFEPSLILLDASTSDGLAAARLLRERAAGVSMLGFGARALDHDMLDYARAGFSGFVPREATIQELLDAIERSSRGELLCSPRVAASMFRQLAELSTGPRDGSPGSLLTEREREIVGLIDAGLSNKKIALSLGIEVATVKNHVHHILEKLQVTRRGEAAARVRAAHARAHGAQHPGSMPI